MGDNERIIEILTELVEKLGGSPLGNFNSKIEEATKGLDNEAKQRKINEMLTKTVNDEFAKLDKSLKSGRKKLVDLGPTIDRLEEELEEMSDGIDKSALEVKKNNLATQYLTAQYKKAAADIIKNTSAALINGVAKTTGAFVRSLQSNSSGVNIAGEVLTNSIDMVQSGFSTVSKAGEAVGTTLSMSTNPKLRAFGIATTGASAVLEGMTSTISKLAKFGIEVMVKEVEKTVKAFNTVSASGALFAGGMGGVRSAAAAAGLTVEQFSNVIKTNASALADTGLTVTEAARRMGQVGRIIRSSGIENNLLKLGFGFEEQAGLIAETMSRLRRSGQLGTATNAQIAEATERYAKNLRFLADLTGKDAEAAMKEAQAKTNQYAVDARIRELAQKFQLDPGKVKDAVDGITAALAQAGQPLDGWMQQLATSTDNFAGANAVTADNISGMRTAYDRMITELNRGNFNLADILQKGGQALGDAATTVDYNSSRAAARAAAFDPGLGDYARGAEAVRQFATFVSDPKAIERALEARVKTEDAATKEILRAEREAQKLRIDQEMILTKQLGNFAKVTAEIVEGLRKTVEKLGMDKGGKAKDIDWVKAGLGAAQVVGGVAATVATGGVGGVVGGGALATSGAIDIYNAFSGEGYASGGIVHRPELAMIAEGGQSEAVVPLPDNRTIPVTVTGNTLDTREITSAIDRQSGLITQLLTAMEKNNQLTSGILQSSY